MQEAARGKAMHLKTQARRAHSLVRCMVTLQTVRHHERHQLGVFHGGSELAMSKFLLPASSLARGT